MIRTYIQQLTADIAALALIERFGGYCDMDVKEGIEVGIKKSGDIDCYGSTYTPDDRFTSVGFVYIKEWESEKFDRTSNVLKLTVVVKFYGNPAKVGDPVPYHSQALDLMTQLNQLRRYNFSGRGNRVTEKFEEATLTEVKTLYVPCDYTFTPGADLNC